MIQLSEINKQETDGSLITSVTPYSALIALRQMEDAQI